MSTRFRIESLRLLVLFMCYLLFRAGQEGAILARYDGFILSMIIAIVISVIIVIMLIIDIKDYVTGKMEENAVTGYMLEIEERNIETGEIWRERCCEFNNIEDVKKELDLFEKRNTLSIIENAQRESESFVNCKPYKARLYKIKYDGTMQRMSTLIKDRSEA